MLDRAYTYDQLGNRLTKTENVALRTTFYHYDVLEPTANFASHNNRLQWYRVYNDVYAVEPDVSTAIEEVMYKYDAGGHPYAIVRKLTGDPTFRALRMNYDSGGQLWLAESWEGSSTNSTWPSLWSWPPQPPRGGVSPQPHAGFPALPTDR